MKVRFAALAVLAALFWSTASSATILTYTDEAAYLAKLSSLSYGQWSENFQGGVWDGLQTTVNVSGNRTYSATQTATSQGITWTPPSYNSYITTEQRSHALPGETPADLWSLTAVTRRNGDFDAFTGSSVNTLFGVGGWFDSLSAYKFDEDANANIPKGHMFVSLDGVAANNFGAGGGSDPNKLVNAIGQFCPTCANVPQFFGIINTAGFNKFAFISDQGTALEIGPGAYYGPIVYADRFTFSGTAPTAANIPEPSTWASMMAGLLLLGMMRRRRPVD